MDASEKTSSSSIPFRSKKTLFSKSKSLLSDQQSLSSKTPEKPAELSTRTRNRKVALSITEVRKAAVGVRESNAQQPRKSVRRKMDSWPNASPSSRSKSAIDKPKEIPEKFQILSLFFDSLDRAMRLLRLRGLASNFSNVCPKIEYLTDRRFSYGHLAQLKFILPEAIELKKVHVFDERTSCMKPDLHISFNLGVLDNQESPETGSQNLNLRKLFCTRLSEFVSSHPEIDEVPKGLLPEPFNRSSQDLLRKTNSQSSVETSIEQLATEQSAKSSTNEAEGMPFNHHSEESLGFRIVKSTVPRTDIDLSKQNNLIGASHFSQSFSRRFFQRVVNREGEKTDQATRPCAQNPSHSDAETSVKTEFCNAVSSSKPYSPVELPSNSTCDSSFENFASPLRFSAPPLPSTPSDVAVRGTSKNEDYPSAKTNDIVSTPAKLVSTPIRLMATTPTMPPPKRSSMSPDDACSTNKLIRRPPRSRSLLFNTPTKEDKNKDDIDDSTRSASLDDGILDILPQSLIQSIREKERKAKEEKMPAISQAKRRRKMIANLPKLFNSIYFLFHKRTVITKEELIFKIISGNLDIVDRREIEEQLALLLELAPEWISEKLASSGDSLLCIDKLSSAETVRARLEEAK